MSTITNNYRIIEDEAGVLHSIPAEHSTETPAVDRPLVDIPMMSDYKWQLSCLNDRLEHPEKYEETEDVQQTITSLRKWLAEHNPE